MVTLFVKSTMDSKDLDNDYQRLTDICDEYGTLVVDSRLDVVQPLLGDPELTGSLRSRKYVFVDDSAEQSLGGYSRQDTPFLSGHVDSRLVHYDTVPSDSWINISYVRGAAVVAEGENLPDEVSKVVEEIKSETLTAKERRELFDRMFDED